MSKEDNLDILDEKRETIIDDIDEEKNPEAEAVAIDEVATEAVVTSTTEAEIIAEAETIAEEENGTQAEDIPLPSSEQFEDELIRVKYRLRYRKLLKNTIYSLLIVAAISVLVATLFLPVLEIYGNSMNPTLDSGDIVVSIKTTNLERGDICCMYYNNHLLVKRVIGLQGDVIEMDEEGNVFVNGEYVDEPYLSEKVLGDCDLEFPYTVPEQTIFVLGDNRPTAVDSRNEQFGSISLEEVVGKIVFRVWPFAGFGAV